MSKTTKVVSDGCEKRKLPAEFLGQIEIKKNEIVRRIEEGTLPLTRVMTELQLMVEGRLGIVTLKEIGCCAVGHFRDQIDYKQSTVDLLKAGKYDGIGDDIEDPQFLSSSEKGKGIIEYSLICFDQVLYSKEAREEIDKHGYRPATMKELLNFGAKHPEVQIVFRVVELGTTAWCHSESLTIPGRDVFVVYLTEHDEGRCITKSSLKKQPWYEGTLFLVVPKGFLLK